MLLCRRGDKFLLRALRLLETELQCRRLAPQHILLHDVRCMHRHTLLRHLGDRVDQERLRRLVLFQLRRSAQRFGRERFLKARALLAFAREVLLRVYRALLLLAADRLQRRDRAAQLRRQVL